jgi:hypothetical protein
MALEPKRLYIGNDTAANVYTASSNVGSYSIIKTINVCNTSGTDKTFSLHILPSGASAAANNKILSNITVAANGIVYSNSVYVLNAGESLYYDPVDSNLTVLVTGVEYTP